MSTYALNVIGEQSAGVIVSGDNNNLEITGSMVVDGDSVGTLVTGNGGKVSQKGDLLLVMPDVVLISVVTGLHSVILVKSR